MPSPWIPVGGKKLMQGYRIEPVILADLPTLTNFLVLHKNRLAINHVLWKGWPDQPAQRESYGAALVSGLYNPERDCIKVVHVASEKIVAWLVVTRILDSSRKTDEKGKESQGPQSPEKGINTFADAMNPAVVKAINDGVAKLGRPSGDHLGDPPRSAETDVLRLELTYMYVEPSSRRKGIGRQLVRHCADIARYEKLPLTLEADPNCHAWFLRRGFKYVSRADTDLREFAAENSGYGLYRVWRMEWPRK
ncbi:hypothetical protein Hte_001786 [Hypoxylon texense]